MIKGVKLYLTRAEGRQAFKENWFQSQLNLPDTDLMVACDFEIEHEKVNLMDDTTKAKLNTRVTKGGLTKEGGLAKIVPANQQVGHFFEHDEISEVTIHLLF